MADRALEERRSGIKPARMHVKWFGARQISDWQLIHEGRVSGSAPRRAHDAESVRDGGWSSRFVDASIIDLDGDGGMEIQQRVNDCLSDCAGGQITIEDFSWNGPDYVSTS